MNFKKKKASLSVEASMAVSLFVMLMVSLLFSLVMVKEQSKELEMLHQKALLYFENSDIGTEPFSTFSTDYESDPSIGQVRVLPRFFSDSITIHSFSGYVKDDESKYDTKETEYVYITETGTKYHTNRECSYIRIVPMAVNAKEVGKMRNKDGGKYYKCSICRPKKEGTLYITYDGTGYHANPDCSALKRTVYVISKEEAIANGYTPCSRCG